MSNSPLVQFTRWSPNHGGPRQGKVSKITIHHVAGVVSVETLGSIFAPISREASSTYGVGFDGRIGQYVDESNHPWTSSSWANDDVAVTIEVSNSSVGGNWPVSDLAIARTIELCADICKRNGIKVLIFTGDARGNLTLHKFFWKTDCPGPYLESKIPYIVAEVNKRLGATAPAPSQGGGQMSFADKAKKSLVDARIMSDGAWDKPATKEQVASWFFTALQKGYFGATVTAPAPAPAPNPAQKSLAVVAKEVIDGLWGNGQDRINRLTTAGYNYDQVQAKVNELLG